MSDPHEIDGHENLVPATKVLAIASHVVYGYVGNVMATFCMQALGCEVAAINTVNFSNHTGYRQFKGTRTTPQEIKDLYQGLTNSHLVDFDVLLSGYIPSAEALHEVALIARDLKTRREVMNPGSFFWILDPVMGDQGRLYVGEDLVKGYKSVTASGLDGPDLIVPNGFELELISGVHLSSDSATSDEDGAALERRPTGDNYEATLDRVQEAIGVLHKRDGIKMIVATSVRVQGRQGVLCVVGSERKSDGASRCFVVEVPVLDCYFSGTGDMFAGLMVGRLREACRDAGTLGEHGWASKDDVAAVELPLAKATVKVLSSMEAVLARTMKERNAEMDEYRESKRASVDARMGDDDREQTHFLAQTKAAEVRAVRNVGHLICPKIKFEALPLS